ncbi:non-ribosomal peptide synthetase [Planomonospora sp. ID91781]|uniref:non-ribosomal peptide synthetase n=1 Tax=Planomonospora sp. ID91781 TaxID=2738135 RepID=UPI0018C372F6|nr:non-ribosomal peptide synthetase [Planomonospora sp. ID91781]
MLTTPRTPTTLELTRRRRDLTPEEVAVSGPGGELTHRELHERVDALAAVLRERGVGPEVPVGICMERTVGMVVAVLAVWAAGGAYVPLDPAFPADRLRLMREDAGAGLVLTQDGVDARLPGGTPRTLVLAPDGTVPGARPAADGPPAPDGPTGDLAYLIYTSGSTGRPKGVAVPHGAVANLIGSFASLLELTPADRWLAVTTLSFDISVLELLLPLTCGARLVVAPADRAADGPALRALAAEERITVMQATPATWRILLEAGGVPETVRTRLCGGEALPRDLADALGSGGARLWNVYGPTETTVWSTAGPVPPAPAPVDLGGPIADTALYLLDAGGDPVPEGEVGELHIGGAGVARGYHGLPALTAGRFLPDPFSGRPGARMYATGDLARIGAAGRLEYLGRADQQVKIRGFRIELGEIETALRAAGEVRQAAVAVREGPDGLPRLVAYVVPAGDPGDPGGSGGPGDLGDPGDPGGPGGSGRRDTSDASDASDVPGDPGGPGDADDPDGPEGAGGLWPVLRARLRAGLPEYMVPAHLVVLDRLPLTPNGKLDRAALPHPDWTRVDGAPYRAPSTPEEKELAAMWTEVLGLAEPVGVDDDFFELGGHSLTAAQIIARVRTMFGVAVPIVALFENPTVAGLARELDRAGDGADDGPDLMDMAALREQLDGLSAEELAALFDELAPDA